MEIELTSFVLHTKSLRIEVTAKVTPGGADPHAAVHAKIHLDHVGLSALSLPEGLRELAVRYEQVSHELRQTAEQIDQKQVKLD